MSYAPRDSRPLHPRTGSRTGSTLAAALLAAAVLLPVTATAQPNVEGQWGPVLPWPLVAVSMANLPDGRVLAYASNERDAFPSGPEFTYATVWDPETGEFLEINHPNHDMFCASLVMLEDGSLFVSGGRNQGDSPWTSIYDYKNDVWVQIEDMNNGRWYPTSVALPTGQVFIAGGIGGGDFPELYTPGQGWQVLTGIDLNAPLLQYGLRDGAGLWPLLQLDRDGRVFLFGAVPDMYWFDPASGLGTSQLIGGHNLDWFPDEGVSVMYDESRMLVAGGSVSTSSSTAVTSAVTIDLSGAAPDIQPTGDMNQPRQFQNEIMLPNGHVLVVGGNRNGAKFNDTQAVLSAESWDPDSGAWTELASQQEARTYHSTATLLVDGRVLSAGGGLDGGNPAVNHWNGEVFSPPYLFDASGNLAQRPVIDDAPRVVRVGRTFPLEGDANLAEASMIKMSATTHTMNTDLRFLRPAFVELSPGSYELGLHSNENVLTPGFWMLFVLDQAGVPSEGHVIQVVTTGTPRGTPIADQRNHIGDAVLLQVEAEDPDGDPLTFTTTGLPDGLTFDPNTALIQGVLSQTGIFNTMITVDDGSEAAVVAFQWFVSQADSEVGTVSVSQADEDEWHTVLLDNVYQNPVVVMGPPSLGDAQPTTVRVRNAQPASFEFQIDEWDYLDGGHGNETLSYMVIEAGAHVVPGGGVVVAGIRTGVDDGLSDVAFPAGAFGQTPAVLAQVASANGSQAATTRLRNVDASGFEVELQKEELGSASLATEEVHWIALETGLVSGLLEVGIVAAVDEVPELIAYTEGFTAPPHLLATMQTTAGSDTAAIRHQNATSDDVELIAEEEQSADVEVGHADEVVGWLAVDPGTGVLALLPLFNSPPSIVDPGDQQGVLGDPILLALQSNDDDGDPLTFAVAGLPTGLDIDENTGEISGSLLAAGSFTVTVTATDPSGDSGGVSFDWTVTEGLQLVPFASPPQPSGGNVDYTAVTNGGGSLVFTWDFGDGLGLVGPDPSPDVSYVFASPGAYLVTLTVADTVTGDSDTIQFYQMIFGPLSPLPPTQSSPIVYEVGADRVWVVNPDNDSVTVIDALGHTKLTEIPVGDSPRTVAIAGDGRVWVANKEGGTIDIIDPLSLSVDDTVQLARGSLPHGLVFDPTGATAFVAFEGSGQIASFDLTGAPLAAQAVGPHPRHLAMPGDGQTLYVSRFITPPLPGEATGAPQTEVGPIRFGGEVVPLDPATLAVGPTIVLHHSEMPDTENSARGIPNYLGALAISPDGTQGWLPSKQDNVKRGAGRDGFDLTDETTVRAITSRIDLGTGVEDEAARIDHDDASVTSAAAYGPFGIYVATTLEGNGEVALIDTFTQGELGRFPVGRAAQGVVFSPDGRTAFVHDFMDRTVTVANLDALYDFSDANATILATIPLVASEDLAPDVLLGKQHFYDASDLRLSLQGYMACASCHNDARHDGRTWDFTQFGEGLRNTISMRGKSGIGHGNVHFSRNFDEIQDFENQIRAFTRGSGLMLDADFAATSALLGPPKAGLSVDLDALAAYAASLTTAGLSPHRMADGSLTAEGEAGRIVFANAGCGSCHSGTTFTDSPQGGFHDIGTNLPTSGLPNGVDTQTLRGLWMTAPYLHDGRSSTIGDAVAAHGLGLSQADVDAVAAYVAQIDDDEASPGCNGLVAEAESGTLLGSFQVLQDGTAFGGQYVSNDHATNFHGSPEPGERVDLCVTVANPGTYRIDTQVRGADSNHNSFYAQVDGGALWTWDTPTGVTWSSDPVGNRGGPDPVEIQLASGQHTVTFYLRETDTDLDRIVLVPLGGPVNNGPTVTNPGNQNGLEGNAVSLQIQANDIDGDPLSYQATGLPPDLSIDGSGLISGSLAAGSAGFYNVTVTVDDGQLPASASFTWSVSASPVGCNGLTAEAESGTLFGAFQVFPDGGASAGAYVRSTHATRFHDTANPAERVDVCVDVAVSGTYRIDTLVRGNGGNHDSFWVQVDGGPIWLWDTDRSGVFASDPVADRGGADPVEVGLGVGQHTVTFYVRENETDLDRITLVPVGPVGNVAPTIVNPGSQASIEGAAVSLQIVANDGDGDPLDYSATGLPPDLQIDPATGLIDGDLAAGSAGVHNVTVTVDDGDLSASAAFLWTVSGPVAGCNGLTAEAESGILFGSFQIVADGAASGGFYATSLHPVNVHSTPEPGERLDLCFDVPSSGNYRIETRVRGADNNHNSYNVQADGAGPFFLWDTATGVTWSTDNVSNRGGADPVVVNLGAGQHVLSFFLRETDTDLDVVTLVPSP